MAIKATIVLHGGKELERKLKTLPTRIRNKVVRQSLREGAKIVQAETKRLTPVYSGPKRKKRSPGVLKSSIKVRAAKRKRGRIGINVQTKDGDYKGETFYGAFVEYGHRLGKRTSDIKRSQKKGKHGEAAGDTRRFIEGKHFMEQAFKNKSPAAAAAIESKLKTGVEREAMV